MARESWKKIKNIIFRIRFRLMPKEFKEGSWLVTNGDFLNISDMWRKTKNGYKFEAYLKGEK